MSNFKKITTKEAKTVYSGAWAIKVTSKNNRLGLERGLYIETNYLNVPIRSEKGIEAISY